MSQSARLSLLHLALAALNDAPHLPEDADGALTIDNVATAKRDGNAVRLSLNATKHAPEIDLGTFTLNDPKSSAEVQRVIIRACAQATGAPIVTHPGRPAAFAHIAGVLRGGHDPIWEVEFSFGEENEVHYVVHADIHAAPDESVATLLLREWGEAEPAPGIIREERRTEVTGTTQGGFLRIDGSACQHYRAGEKARLVEQMLMGVTFTEGGELHFGRLCGPVAEEGGDTIFEVLSSAGRRLLPGKNLTPVTR